MHSRDKDTATRDKDTVTRDKDTVTRDKDTTTRDKDTVTRDKDTVTRDKDTVTRDKDTVTRGQNTVNRDQRNRGKDTATSYKDTVTSDKDVITTRDKDTVPGLRTPLPETRTTCNDWALLLCRVLDHCLNDFFDHNMSNLLVSCKGKGKGNTYRHVHLKYVAVRCVKCPWLVRGIGSRNCTVVRGL
jgi:hypothetical protein